MHDPQDNAQQTISYSEADAIEKVKLSSVNVGPADGGIMGAHMVDTYLTSDGRTLINEWGNGGGTWYFKRPL